MRLWNETTITEEPAKRDHAVTHAHCYATTRQPTRPQTALPQILMRFSSGLRGQQPELMVCEPMCAAL